MFSTVLIIVINVHQLYVAVYKNDLSKDITSDTSGDFQKALLALAKVFIFLILSA